MTDLPLSGIRVTDLSRVFAMPYAGAYLADLGAEVIKVDSCQAQFMDTTRTLNGPYPDNDPGELHWERGGTFQTLNRGKRSLTLDLRSETAVGLLKDLVRVSDIVLENFTPRVMNRFGLDYASLRAVKPDLIMVSNTGYGHSGPWSNFGAMATALEPTHGTGAFIGYQDSVEDGRLTEGSVPNKIGNSYTDFLASWTAQLAVMASLLHRARTGRGMWIDLAMYQVGVSFMGAGVLDYAFNGRRTNRIGNRHGAMAPHGCYPCRGNDEWVTIAVRDDADWVSFCQALGQPSLAADPRFATAQTRLGHQEELDAIIAAWTGEQGQYQVMENLQARGVPAGPVLNA
ncbi:MAG: CoA transferase, partial [Chloroflexi bacterium]|nr:CoA transferase [Chloroflexota bacterium]